MLKKGYHTVPPPLLEGETETTVGHVVDQGWMVGMLIIIKYICIDLALGILSKWCLDKV